MALPSWHTVSDYATADAFLGPKDERPAGNNTRIRRDVAALAIRVRFHFTDVVTYYPDGSFELQTNGWTTPTTRQRIYRFCPVVRFGPHWSIAHATDELTAPKVWKCRTCHGTGLGIPWTDCGHSSECHVGIGRYGEHLGEHGYLNYFGPNGSYMHPPEWVPADHEYLPVEHVRPCYRCNGEGRADYGSKPITFPWGGQGTVHIDATGKVIDAVAPTYPLGSIAGYTAYSGPVDTGPPPVDIGAEMAAAVPGLMTVVRYPCTPCGVGRVGSATVREVIIHLNDHHSWPREDVADWLESLDADLTFRGEVISK